MKFMVPLDSFLKDMVLLVVVVANMDIVLAALTVLNMLLELLKVDCLVQVVIFLLVLLVFKSQCLHLTYF